MYFKKNIIFKIFFCLIFLFLSNKIIAQNKIIEKYGPNCPSGFYSSGGFCKSHKGNKRNVILNKNKKNCPTGYFSSGIYYCLSY
tara:strand:- start:516 stop:767 length:252 start_codon:yes stop_codon:yes gene_type:complete